MVPGAMVFEADAGAVLLRQGETDKEGFFVLRGKLVDLGLGLGNLRGQLAGFVFEPSIGDREKPCVKAS